MCIEILHGHTCMYNMVVYDAYMFVSTYVWPQYRFICLQIHVYIYIYIYTPIIWTPWKSVCWCLRCNMIQKNIYDLYPPTMCDWKRDTMESLNDQVLCEGNQALSWNFPQDIYHFWRHGFRTVAGCWSRGGSLGRMLIARAVCRTHWGYVPNLCLSVKDMKVGCENGMEVQALPKKYLSTLLARDINTLSGRDEEWMDQEMFSKFWQKT